MHETQPQVRLIARPQIVWENVFDYLAGVGADRYAESLDERVMTTDVSSGDYLAEFAGKTCYRSWEPGLNANVSKVREDPAEYIANIIRSGHGAVTEHAQYTFDFANISRVFSHELVRHRAGVAISQESLRYVRLTDIGFRIPDILEPHREAVVSIVEQLEDVQRSLADAYGLDDDGVPFHVKKEVTSALRRIAPMGLSTTMVWSANLRTLRHVIELRTAPGAEEEIRIVFDEVARIMVNECPAIFADFTRLEDGSWVSLHAKV